RSPRTRSRACRPEMQWRLPTSSQVRPLARDARIARSRSTFFDAGNLATHDRLAARAAGTAGEMLDLARVPQERVKLTRIWPRVTFCANRCWRARARGQPPR